MALKYPAFANNGRVRRAATNSPWMARGETGAGVAVLQAALIDVGHAMPISTRKKGVPDGVYGAETRSTALAFQTKQKLKGQDGVAGRETFTRLDTLMVAKGIPPQVPPSPPARPVSRDYKIGTADPTITPDPGAGPWNSKPKTMTVRVQKELILEILPPRGSSSSLIIGDDAARHMLHYMNNTGRTLTIDLEGMIDEVKTANGRFRNEVNQAKTFVGSLSPGTHQITSRTAEGAYNRKSETKNWFFAIGGYSTWGKGEARVMAGAGAREYELDFEYKFFDRYNWDGGKKVTIGPVTITDQFMGEFHRQGLAREYNCVGSIRRRLRWREGQAIPPQQLLPSGNR